MSHIIGLLISAAVVVAGWLWMFATEPQIAKAQALLTPVVAVLAVCVALAQWNIARNKLKSDLFEQRFPIYEATRGMVLSMAEAPTQTTEQVDLFVEVTKGAYFLFDYAVAEYIEDIGRRGRDVEAKTRRLKNDRQQTSDEKRAMAEQRDLHRLWAIDQVKNRRVEAVFKDFLQLRT